MLVTWLLITLTLLSSGAHSQTSKSFVCSDILASQLVSELVDIREVVSDSISSKFTGLSPDQHLTNSSLRGVYKAFSKKVTRNETETGYYHFLESFNLITAYYREASLHQLHPENIQTLLQKFKKAYGTKNSVELCDMFGKILNVNDFNRGRNVQRREIEDCGERDCSCPEGGIKSTELFCSCQFFDCLDQQKNLVPIFEGFEGLECLAFVLDTTGSMKDEFDDTVQVIKDLTVASQELGCFMLVPFNDNGNSNTSVGPTTLTFVDDSDPNSIKSLQNLVSNLENAFNPSSGGDCPEFCYDGITEALNTEDYGYEVMVEGSQVVVITDAPSKGEFNATDVIKRANDEEVCIHFFLGQSTYNCFEDYPQSLEEYERIAYETGGIVVKNKFDFTIFLQKYKSTPCGFLKVENSRHKRNTAEICQNFTIASLVCLLSVSIQTTEENVTVIPPDGENIHVTTSKYERGTEKIALFSKNHPPPGEWRVCGGDKPFKISVDYQTCLDIAPFYIKMEGEPTLTATTAPECTSAHIVVLSNRSVDINSSVLYFIDRIGNVALETSLQKCDDSMSANITMPSTGTYYYKLAGEDIRGIPFTRLIQRKISVASGTEYYSLTGIGPEKVEALTGQIVTLMFELNSTNFFGPVTFNLVIAENISPRLVEPPQAILLPGETIKVNVTVRPMISNQQVTLVASNECFNITAQKRVETTQPITTAPVPEACDPQCLNGGTCVSIQRRRRQFHVCRCTSDYRGRACERFRN